jgi:hypothetical protein
MTTPHDPWTSPRVPPAEGYDLVIAADEPEITP